MTSTTEVTSLTRRLCEGLALIPGKRQCDLAQKIKSAHGSYLVEIMPETIATFRSAREVLHRLKTQNEERINEALKRNEVEDSAVVTKRRKLEELYALIEDLRHDAPDLLKNHLPESATSLKAVQFGKSVLLHFHSHRHAEEVFAKAQRPLYEWNSTRTADIFEEVSTEAAEITLAANALLDGLVPSLRRFVFREPGFFPVTASTVWDPYELLRSIGQGSGMLHNLKPIQKYSAWITKWLRIPVNTIVAGKSFESLAAGKRTAMRRDLAGAAAEQMRRNHTAALQQLQSFLQEITQEIRKGAALYFEQQRCRYVEKSRELNRSLQQSREYAARTERDLLFCEQIAREIMAGAEQIVT